MGKLFGKDLIEKVKCAQSAQIIQPVQIGQTDRKNELVFFIKPELFNVDDNEKIINSLNLIEEEFNAFQVDVRGTAILPGQVLAEYQIMNRHYGFINQLSRMASEMLDHETRQQMFEMLSEEDRGEHQILGGHEFLGKYQTTIEALNDIWFGKGAKKLRSGFYFIEDTYKGDPILMVNGFHPSQLMHFTHPDHRIMLMLIHTDSDWYDLKFDLVGDTFPERANPGSIRGQLFAHPEKYGQDHVGINTNGVHLSAGPFEAAFEVVNFFGQLLSLAPEKTLPLAIRHAIEAGIDKTLALSFLDNPAVNGSDLFSETENLNTNQAIAFAKQQIMGG